MTSPSKVSNINNRTYQRTDYARSGFFDYLYQLFFTALHLQPHIFPICAGGSRFINPLLHP